MGIGVVSILPNSPSSLLGEANLYFNESIEMAVPAAVVHAVWLTLPFGKKVCGLPNGKGVAVKAPSAFLKIERYAFGAFGLSADVERICGPNME